MYLTFDDGYELTAEIVARAAHWLLEEGPHRGRYGWLAPAEVVNPRRMLQELSAIGLAIATH
jgi:hypothetical protein